VDTFTIGNLITIRFLEGSENVNLAGHKFQHKFLYVISGSGVITIDHRVFDFSDGSIYTFRLATTVEIVATDPVVAFVVVFNTTPFRHSELIKDENNFLRRIQIIEKFFSDTPDTQEYLMENLADKDSILDLLKVTKREMSFPAEYSNEVIVNNILSIVNVALRQQPKANDKKAYIQRSPVSVQMMRIAEQMVNENQKVTIIEVARRLELSEYALNKIFIKHSGITFSNFLRNVKSRYVGF
jgi:mannose-6-phosphate isomerase-like protein (cupin superfamily)/AraC-like DNA-binding protein